MHNKLKLIISVIGIVICSHALAGDMPKLAVKKNCTGCHAVEKRVIGPSFVNVAKWYKGNKDASVILTNKIRSGGSGVWGQHVMPKQPVSDDEARTLANFILGLPTTSLRVVRSQNDSSKDMKPGITQ